MGRDSSPAHDKDQTIAADIVVVPEWSPNKLWHSRATELRQHGLDVVKTILGHSRIETTQIHSEKNLASAMELVGRGAYNQQQRDGRSN